MKRVRQRYKSGGPAFNVRYVHSKNLNKVNFSIRGNSAVHIRQRTCASCGSTWPETRNTLSRSGSEQLHFLIKTKNKFESFLQS